MMKTTMMMATTEYHSSWLAGPDLRGGANWAVALGPPQLRGLHKKQ